MGCCRWNYPVSPVLYGLQALCLATEKSHGDRGKGADLATEAAYDMPEIRRLASLRRKRSPHGTPTP